MIQLTNRSVRIATVGAGFVMCCSVCFARSEEKEHRINLLQALKKQVLVFPIDVPDAVPGRQDARQMLTSMFATRLSLSGSYAVTQYYKSLPIVARLKNDQQLSDADVAEPFADDNVKSVKIGKLVNFDVVAIGSIDDYQYNGQDKQATVLFSARLVDVKTSKFIGAPVTQSAASSKGGTGKEADKALEAVRTAGEQVLGKLVPVGSTTIEKPIVPVKNVAVNTQKKKKSNDWVWGLLAVAVGLGVGLASSGGRGGGSSDGPPPPP